MRIYGSEAEPLTWSLAIKLLGVRATIPLWRQAGVPVWMFERPLALLRTARRVSDALDDLSSEAGERERRRESDVRGWYDAEQLHAVVRGFESIAAHYGWPAARDLAAWVVGTAPGSESYVSGERWWLTFGLIADGRPSPGFVRENVPRRALLLIRAAFGRAADHKLEQCERRASSVPFSAREVAIISYDPSTLQPGESPLRDVVMEMRLHAGQARALALCEVISRLMSEEEWATFERLARDWPW